MDKSNGNNNDRSEKYSLAEDPQYKKILDISSALFECYEEIDRNITDILNIYKAMNIYKALTQKNTDNSKTQNITQLNKNLKWGTSSYEFVHFEKAESVVTEKVQMVSLENNAISVQVASEAHMFAKEIKTTIYNCGPTQPLNQEGSEVAIDTSEKSEMHSSTEDEVTEKEVLQDTKISLEEIINEEDDYMEIGTIHKFQD